MKWLNSVEKRNAPWLLPLLFSTIFQFRFAIFALHPPFCSSSAHRKDEGQGFGCWGRGLGLFTEMQTISKHDRHRLVEFFIRSLLLPLSGTQSGVEATEPLCLKPPAGFICQGQWAVMTSSSSKWQMPLCIYLFLKKGLWLASFFPFKITTTDKYPAMTLCRQSCSFISLVINFFCYVDISFELISFKLWWFGVFWASDSKCTVLHVTIALDPHLSFNAMLHDVQT